MFLSLTNVQMECIICKRKEGFVSVFSYASADKTQQIQHYILEFLGTGGLEALELTGFVCITCMHLLNNLLYLKRHIVKNVRPELNNSEDYNFKFEDVFSTFRDNLTNISYKDEELPPTPTRSVKSESSTPNKKDDNLSITNSKSVFSSEGKDDAPMLQEMFSEPYKQLSEQEEIKEKIKYSKTYRRPSSFLVDNEVMKIFKRGKKRGHNWTRSKKSYSRASSRSRSSSRVSHRSVYSCQTVFSYDNIQSSCFECDFDDQCYSTFVNLQQLTNHKKNVHNLLDKFWCEECHNTRFTTQDDLDTHVITEHDKLLSNCLHCSKEFQNASTYYQHLREHKFRSYPCSYCDKTFIDRLSCISHVKQHHKEKKELPSIKKSMVIMGRHFSCEKSQRESQEYLEKKDNFVTKILIQPGYKEDEGDIISKALKDYTFDLQQGKNTEGSESQISHNENQIDFEQETNMIRGNMDNDKLSNASDMLSGNINNDINVSEIVSKTPESNGILHDRVEHCHENTTNDQEKDDFCEMFTDVGHFEEVTSDEPGSVAVTCSEETMLIPYDVEEDIHAKGDNTILEINDGKYQTTNMGDELSKGDNDHMLIDFPHAHQNNYNLQEAIVNKDTCDENVLANMQGNNFQPSTDSIMKDYKDISKTSKILNTELHKLSKKSKNWGGRKIKKHNPAEAHTTGDVDNFDKARSKSFDNSTDDDLNSVISDSLNKIIPKQKNYNSSKIKLKSQKEVTMNYPKSLRIRRKWGLRNSETSYQEGNLTAVKINSLDDTDSVNNAILGTCRHSKMSNVQINMNSELHINHDESNTSKGKTNSDVDTKALLVTDKSPGIMESSENCTAEYKTESSPTSFHEVISQAYTKLIDVINKNVNNTGTASKTGDKRFKKRQKNTNHKPNSNIDKHVEQDVLNSREMDEEPRTVRINKYQTNHFISHSQNEEMETGKHIKASTSLTTLELASIDVTNKETISTIQKSNNILSNGTQYLEGCERISRSESIKLKLVESPQKATNSNTADANDINTYSLGNISEIPPSNIDLILPFDKAEALGSINTRNKRKQSNKSEVSSLVSHRKATDVQLLPNSETETFECSGEEHEISLKSLKSNLISTRTEDTLSPSYSIQDNVARKEAKVVIVRLPVELFLDLQSKGSISVDTF